jgi:hypothetical protein
VKIAKILNYIFVALFFSIPAAEAQEALEEPLLPLGLVEKMDNECLGPS